MAANKPPEGIVDTKKNKGASDSHLSGKTENGSKHEKITTSSESKDGSNTRSMMFLLTVVLTALVGVYLQQYPHMIKRSLMDSTLGESANILPPKHKSILGRMRLQQLLRPSGKCKVSPEQVGNALVHVKEPMAGEHGHLKKAGKVFVMLNGKNEGAYFKYEADNSNCMFELAMIAGDFLGADPVGMANGVKFMTQMGEPVVSEEELDTKADRIVHILVDFQLWVWPGIEVGHKFNVGDVKLTTMSLSPNVFSVENFFTDEEADQIIANGEKNLQRSPVDSNDAPDGYSDDRTSDTAFLDDDNFTRDFRHRTALVAKLPSASFTERMQLVRYKTGQFFRQHEDYFNSKSFLPKQDAVAEYTAWATWAREKLLSFDQNTLPAHIQIDQPLFPDPEDNESFQHAILQAFIDDCDETGYFEKKADKEWGDWIRLNVNNKATGIMQILLKDKAYMLKDIIKSWESRVGVADLRYEQSDAANEVNGVSHYFYWIRWAKEEVYKLGDRAPEIIRFGGFYAPQFRMDFQCRLVELILKDFTKEEFVKNGISEEWYEWLEANKELQDVLVEALKDLPLFPMVLQSWEKLAEGTVRYQIPRRIKHFEPNRFVTLFLYLNDVPEGGETVFPYSKERIVTGIERDGMKECSDGLAIPARKLRASLFYCMTAENDVDPLSQHGGCPPAKGVKFGANSFTWNVDADEGANAWGFGG